MNFALLFVRTYGLYKAKKQESFKFTMVIAWTKQARAKGYFRHESQMGHAIAPSTTLVYAYWQQMRQKKGVVYGLLFLLHDLADLGFFANPIRKPYFDQNL